MIAMRRLGFSKLICSRGSRQRDLVVAMVAARILQHPDFLGERLVACRNADLARKRAIKRENLIEATIKELEKVKKMVLRRRLYGKEDIGARVHGVLNKYTIGKHFVVDIGEDGFDCKVDEDAFVNEVTK
jgi:hypothetical protein